MVPTSDCGEAVSVLLRALHTLLHRPCTDIGAHSVFSVHGNHTEAVLYDLRGHVTGNKTVLDPLCVGRQTGHSVRGDPSHIRLDQAVGKYGALLLAQACLAHDLKSKLLHIFYIITHDNNSFFIKILCR